MDWFAAPFNSLGKESTYAGAKLISRAKPAFFHFCSSDFNVQGHILSTDGDALMKGIRSPNTCINPKVCLEFLFRLAIKGKAIMSWADWCSPRWGFTRSKMNCHSNKWVVGEWTTTDKLHYLMSCLFKVLPRGNFTRSKDEPPLQQTSGGRVNQSPPAPSCNEMLVLMLAKTKLH